MVHNGFTDQGPTIGTPCIARFNFLRSQDSLRLKLDFFVIFPGAYVGLMLVGLEPARMMHRLPVLSSGQTVNTCRPDGASFAGHAFIELQDSRRSVPNSVETNKQTYVAIFCI